MKFLVSTANPSLLALGLLLVFGVITPAAAQNYPERHGANAEQACQNDAYRFCERYIPDRKTTGACLRRNKRLLSPECAAFFGGRKLRRR
jgi:hypothetical protein